MSESITLTLGAETPTTLAAPVIRYFASVPKGRIVLWCYLLWYFVTVFNHFDPSPAIWLNSLGITVVIGFALLLSVGGGPGNGASGWQTFRLFLMPFCVSSFSSLIKGKGFILIFPPTIHELTVSIAVCAIFLFLVWLLRLTKERSNPEGNTFFPANAQDSGV